MRFPGLTWHLVFVVTVSSIGSGFQHGYNLGVLSTPTEVLKTWVSTLHRANHNDKASETTLNLIWSIVINIYCIGGIIGALLSGVVIESSGSRSGLLYNNVIAVAGAVLQFSSKYIDQYEVVIVGRFLAGINSGICSGLCTLYVFDVSPKNLRGAMGCMYFASVNVAIVIAYVVGMEKNLGNERWNFMLGVPVVPAVVQFVLIYLWIPDTPRRLLIVEDNIQLAVDVLEKLRGETADLRSEITEMRAEKTYHKLIWKDFNRDPVLRKPLIVASLLMVAQLMSGIVAVSFFFCHELLVDISGLTRIHMEYANIAQASAGTFITILTLTLLVETFGRKPLLLASLTSMLISQTALLTGLVAIKNVAWLSYFSIASMFATTISFSVGLGCIPWFLAQEMFPQNAKHIAQAIVTSVNWGMAFFTSMTFSFLVDCMGHYVFALYIVSNLVSIVCVAFFVPETRNKSMEEVEGFFKTIIK